MNVSPLIVLAFAFSTFADVPFEAYGPLYKAAPQLSSGAKQGPRKGLDSVRRWNQIAIDASGLDHTPPAPGENRVYAQQLGPGRAVEREASVQMRWWDASRLSESNRRPSHYE